MAASRILVIKLGAFGNVVLSLAAFGAIRTHHPDAEISVLTTAPYAGWLGEAPWFDHVLVDERPNWWDVPGILRLRRMLADGRFDRVYDLQTSSRSSWYFRLFPNGARPAWSGIAPGCSLPDRDPERDRMHDMDRQFGQLRQAGIADIPPVDLSWSRGDIARFGLSRDIALLVPGSSPHRPSKRWPAERYGALARHLRDQGITPVVLGAGSEAPLAAAIPDAVDLTGQTGFGDLTELARAARIAVGNDTGPMHLLAAAGCRSVVLFSADSDPALCAPRGQSVTVLRRASLADLPLDDVLRALCAGPDEAPEHVSSPEALQDPRDVPHALALEHGAVPAGAPNALERS
jgi:ADP-heptose:LPS heptosyltransferase